MIGALTPYPEGFHFRVQPFVARMAGEGLNEIAPSCRFSLSGKQWPILRFGTFTMINVT